MQRIAVVHLIISFQFYISIRLNAQLVLYLRHADSKEDNEDIEKGKTFWATQGVVVQHTLFKVICAKYRKI